jgi:hypothetical protein
MPVEIKELVIKATINEATASNLSGTNVSMTISAADRELLIQEIQERVIAALTGESEKEQRGSLPSSFHIPAVRER